MEMRPPSLVPPRAMRAALTITFAALTGCVTASVESRPLTPEELTAPPKEQTLEGVIFFPPRPYLLVYHYTQFDGAALRPPPKPGAADTRALRARDPEDGAAGAPRLRAPADHGAEAARHRDGAIVGDPLERDDHRGERGWRRRR